MLQTNLQDSSQNIIDNIFERHKFIPEFCFGCYKVQIEVDSIIVLIKLFLVFNALKLENRNTRKSMFETKTSTSGFYKDLNFCSSLNEALKISEKQFFS